MDDAPFLTDNEDADLSFALDEYESTLGSLLPSTMNSRASSRDTSPNLDHSPRQSGGSRERIRPRRKVKKPKSPCLYEDYPSASDLSADSDLDPDFVPSTASAEDEHDLELTPKKKSKSHLPRNVCLDTVPSHVVAENYQERSETLNVTLTVMPKLKTSKKPNNPSSTPESPQIVQSSTSVGPETGTSEISDAASPAVVQQAQSSSCLRGSDRVNELVPVGASFPRRPPVELLNARGDSILPQTEEYFLAFGRHNKLNRDTKRKYDLEWRCFERFVTETMGAQVWTQIVEKEMDKDTFKLIMSQYVAERINLKVAQEEGRVQNLDTSTLERIWYGLVYKVKILS